MESLVLIVCLQLTALLWIGALVYLCVRLHSRLDMLEVSLQEPVTFSVENLPTPMRSPIDVDSSVFAGKPRAK